MYVTVSEGTLEGELTKNEHGGTYYSFRGIPYAKPPLGDLRFKAPQPAAPWEGVRSAKVFRDVCCQDSQKGYLRGSEDCLYLNVYTPSIEPDEPRPVMFWIHGGSFKDGSGNDYLFSPDFLVRHGVILVTFNYRLGSLGFLCLHTEDIPGNAGMKDQVAALRWVKRNIRCFGGNPDNITIFGNSAGAASVCLHLISPITKGLFQRAIAISGCSSSWWAHTLNPLERALSLSRTLGFHSENIGQVSNFFKELPVESLVNVNVPLSIGNNACRTNVFANIPFAVVSEQTFPNTEAYYQEGKEPTKIHEGVEVIIGYNADEGVLIVPKDKEYDDFVLDINEFRELLIPTLIYENNLTNQQISIAKKMKKYYFGDDTISRENWEQLSRYFGMETIVYDIMKWIKLNCGQKTYLYKFSCQSERNIMSSRHGLFSWTRNKEVVSHADELGYIFNAKVMDNVDKYSAAYKMISNVTELFTNFAKYGNPTPDDSLGVRWLPYTVERQDYLDIGNQLIPKTQPDINELRFWEDIFTEYGSQYTYVYKANTWDISPVAKSRHEEKIP